MEKRIKVKWHFPLFVMALILFYSSISLAGSFCVSTADELQEALSIASNNGEDDQIKIVQGTYIGNFIYASSEAYGITIEGGYTTDSCETRTADPINTILDGNNTDRVLVLSGYSATTFSVDGITIQNGGKTDFGDWGAGLYVNMESSGTLLLNNNRFINNRTNFRGGGVYINGYTTLINITSNIFNNNHTDNGNGTALFIWCGQKAIINNNIFNNNSNPIPSSEYMGHGAIVIYNTSEVSISQNTITDNIGGAIAIRCPKATITQNIISGNSCLNGGGINVEGGEMFLMTNNVIINNSVNKNGGGIYCYFPIGIAMINNTISGNVAENGGGIYFELNHDNHYADIYNNIIWNNTANTGSDIFINNDGNNDFIPSLVNLFYNDFDQSSEEIYIKIPFSIDSSNLDNEDPLFAEAMHLQSSSPCIDLGDPDTTITDDIDSEARPQNSAYDIGADEFYDFDEDNIPDYWELKWFGNLSPTSLSDYDEDQLLDINEFIASTNPILKDIPGGSITGIVTDSLSGLPISNVSISTNIGLENITDNSGEYLLENISPGDYTLTVTAPLYYSLTIENVSVIAGEATTQDISLDPKTTGSITGQVLSAEGLSPIANATIQITNGTDIYTVTSDSDGYFTFDNITHGEYIIQIINSYYWGVPENISVSIDETIVVSPIGISQTIVDDIISEYKPPPFSKELVSGWNLVGYNSDTGKDIAEALASIKDQYISVWAYVDGKWWVYDPVYPGFSDLELMEPGYGYWINTKTPCTWTLP